MTFAAATLQIAGSSGGGGGGSITNVTTGVGSSANARQSYTWWGWLQSPAFAAAFGPDSAIGSPTPASPSLYGYTLVGVYAGDGGSGTSNAYTYNVAVAGSAPTGTVNSLTVAGTTISNFTLTTITTYQPAYTIFRFGMNSPAAELFGTSGTVTCTIA